jgi:DNA-binding NarL/FixJ family response regulator
MTRICCLAAVDPEDIQLLSAALKGAGESALSILARLDVAELGRLRPDVLIADVDHLDVDPLEALRQIRFVLPECTIAVYTAKTTSIWGRACHLAGVSCLLSKASCKSELVIGLRSAIRIGCFTDPRFAA